VTFGGNYISYINRDDIRVKREFADLDLYPTDLYDKAELE